MGYEYTAKWCDHICKNLSQYTKLPKMLQQDLDDLFLTFKNEYVNLMVFGSPNLREKYLTIVQILLENVIINSPNPKKMFHELIPFRDQELNTSQKTAELAKVFGNLREQHLEVRLYASLFIFMLHLEGNYFPMLRELCALKLSGDGKEVLFSTIQKMNLTELKEELGTFGEPLFKVYDDVGRKLRNAIAHANFKYENGKVICWNCNQKTKQEIWKRDFTFDDLSSVSADLYSLSHAFIVWYMIRELSTKIFECISRRKR